MNINWNAVAGAADDIAGVLESPEFQSIVALGGPEAAMAAKLAGGAATLVQHFVGQAQEAGSAIASGDLATIQQAQASIQAKNDALAAQIAQS